MILKLESVFFPKTHSLHTWPWNLECGDCLFILKVNHHNPSLEAEWKEWFFGKKHFSIRYISCKTQEGRKCHLQVATFLDHTLFNLLMLEGCKWHLQYRHILNRHFVFGRNVSHFLYLGNSTDYKFCKFCQNVTSLTNISIQPTDDRLALT